MALRASRFQPDRAAPLALLCGPVVLALQTSDGKLPKLPWQDLASCKHILSITLIGEKTAASHDRYLNVAGFDILDK